MRCMVYGTKKLLTFLFKFEGSQAKTSYGFLLVFSAQKYLLNIAMSLYSTTVYYVRYTLSLCVSPR